MAIRRFKLWRGPKKKADESNYLTGIERDWGVEELKEYVAYKYGPGTYLATSTEDSKPWRRQLIVDEFNHRNLIERYANKEGQPAAPPGYGALGDDVSNNSEYIEIIKLMLTEKLEEIHRSIQSLQDEWEKHRDYIDEVLEGDDDEPDDPMAGMWQGMAQNWMAGQMGGNGGFSGQSNAPPPNNQGNDNEFADFLRQRRAND